MRNETIPPSINCEDQSDYIEWEDSPFFVNREVRPWPASDRPRRAAVSSFGMSGTNAHVVIEAPPARSTVDQRLPHNLLLVSAKTEEALAHRLNELADHLEERDEDLASVSRTLMTGRHHFAHRRALVVRDRDDAVRLLRAAATSAKEPGLYRGTVGRDFVANQTIEKTVTGIASSAATLHDDADARRDHLRALAEFYCQGHFPAFDGMWPSLPPLVSLPHYPFAAEHHWVAATPPPTQARPLHPLVHEHTSDGTVHRFRTQFTGGEAVLTDLLVPADPATSR
jgi:acyl transferase domain-containing protein